MEITSIFIDRIINEAIRRGATNIHLSAGSVPALRINGSLEYIEKESAMTADLLDKAVKFFLDEKAEEELKKQREFSLVKSFNNSARFRVNIFFQKNLPSLSLSYIPSVVPHLADLGLPREFFDTTLKRHGLLIVAGPNDSGKSSTSSSVLEEINHTQKKYIVTLENPIEYNLINRQSVIEQRQVGRDIENFKTGLENCLSEDVDVVYLSDLRGELSSALPLIFDLAAGNALVIMEMRAENTVQALEKIINAAGDKNSREAFRYALADILLGVLSQRLLPKRGGGMALAAEVFWANPAARSLIREGKILQLDGIIQTSKSEGMISLEKSLEKLVSAGVISQEEAEKFNS